MNYVVDASVAVKFYVPEVFEEEASMLLAGGHVFHAPELLYPEFMNIIWKKARIGELVSGEALEIIEAFIELDLVTHSNRDFIRSSFEGAQASGQTVYDWTYLALAVSLGCRFVTADRKFYESLDRTSLNENLLWIADI